MKTSTVHGNFIFFDYGKKKVAFESITHFKSEFGNYTKVFLKESKGFLSAFTIKHYSEKLQDEATFMTIRKGVIVNKAFVNRLDQQKEGTFLLMLNGEKFKVSRRRKEEILRNFA